MNFFWAVLIIGFGIIEASSPQLICIWLAGGSIGGLVASMAGLSVIWQIIIFIIVSSLLIVFTRPLVSKLKKDGNTATNADALIGQTAVVTEDIDNLYEKGAVKLRGVTWSARTEDGEPLEAGNVATVCRIEGVKLYVKK